VGSGRAPGSITLEFVTDHEAAALNPRELDAAVADVLLDLAGGGAAPDAVPADDEKRGTPRR
jgi:hypothetical protein